MMQVIQQDDWFQLWLPIILEVIKAFKIDYVSDDGQERAGHWLYFPFGGGLYDQKRINGATWSLWNYIINLYLEELKFTGGKKDDNIICD